MKMYYKSIQSPLTPERGTTKRSPLGLGASWLAYGLSLLLFFAYGQARAQVFAYVPNNGANSVSVINTTTNLVTTTITGVTGAYGVTVSSDGSKAYITGGTSSNVVYVITTATNTVTATIPVGSVPISAAISPNGSRVYVPNIGGGTVSVINTTTNTVIATVTVGSLPHGAVVSPDGSKVYVPDLVGNTVFVINTATNTVSATITVGSAPFAVTITPDGSKVYVTNNGGSSVSVINTVTNTVTATIPIGGSPTGITITPDGTKAYVANGNNVSVINTATNTLTTTVGVGTNAVGISVTPDGSKVYVANGGSGNVSVINTATNTVSATITVGSTPTGLGNMIGIVYAPPTLQYRTAGAVTFTSATNWESSPDGTTWSAAASAPDATANTLAITIRNGHTATIGASITLDQLTVAVGGTLVVSTGVTLTVADGAGTDMTVAGTVDVQGTGSITDGGTTETFETVAGAKIITSHLFGITGGGILATNPTWANGVDYLFNGTANQTANLPAPIGFTVRDLEINNTAGVTFDNASFTVAGTLTLTVGSMDLSGTGAVVNFSGGTPIVRTAGNLITDENTALGFTGTGSAFTLPNSVFAFSPASLNALTISRTNDLSLGNQNIAGTVSINSTGKLNLNGNNIIIAGTSAIIEDLANNRVIYDATATSPASPGGYIEVSGVDIPAFVNGSYTDVRGIGLEIEGALTAITQVRRYHYPPTTGGGANVSKGIKRIFAITGTAAHGVTDIKIKYASSELNGISDANPADMYISRWSSGTGWQSFQHDGTSVIFTAGSIEIKDITTGFSDWTMSGAPAPLPITLLGLKGERVEGLRGEMTEDVRLEWSTASEINNKGFEVEMSKNGRDYTKIAFMEGRGNTTTIQPYNHTTIQPNDAYYRLRQVDFDGTFSYSPIVFVEGMAGKVVVYPNPNNGNFTIKTSNAPSGQGASVRIFDAQGIEVPFTVESNKITISPFEGRGASPSGIYFLHTVEAGKVQITKIIIQK